jgi:hypothetical protein
VADMARDLLESARADCTTNLIMDAFVSMNIRSSTFRPQVSPHGGSSGRGRPSSSRVRSTSSRELSRHLPLVIIIGHYHPQLIVNPDRTLQLRSEHLLPCLDLPFSEGEADVRHVMTFF